MEASLRYISYHDNHIVKGKSIPTDIVRDKLRKLKKTAVALNSLVEVVSKILNKKEKSCL